MMLSRKHILGVALWSWLLLVASAEELSCQADDSGILPPPAIPTKTLSNGVEMPVLSLGTAHFTFGSAHKDGTNATFVGFYPERAYRQTELALRKGIRSFDSALMYGSQVQLGRVLGNWWASGQLASREDVFITTKVYHMSAPGFGLDKNHQSNLSGMSPEDRCHQANQRTY